MIAQLRYLILSIFVFSFLSISSPAEAATVAGVKGKKLLINLQGEPAIKGDIFFLLDGNGKKRAIIKIMKIKGDKALALLGKGKAQKGFTLQYRPKKNKAGKTAKRPKSSKSAKSSQETSASDSSSTPAGGMGWGIMAGYAMDTMDVELQAPNTNGNVSLDGTGYSVKGFLDYNLFTSVWFRGFFGVEQFNTSGDAKCGDSPFTSTCEVEIMYLSLDMWARYLLSEGSFRPWIGGGFSLMFPLSQTSTALEESSITNTSVMSLGLGADLFLSDTMYIPFSVEYGLLPSSDTVEASLIAIRVGVGFPF